jgi:hypothetical protein
MSQVALNFKKLWSTANKAQSNPLLLLKQFHGQLRP